MAINFIFKITINSFQKRNIAQQSNRFSSTKMKNFPALSGLRSTIAHHFIQIFKAFWHKEEWEHQVRLN